MTLEQMRQSAQEFLLATDVAEVLQLDASAIRFMAHERPELLGFPTVAYKRSERSQTWHVKIPRRGFLHWLEKGGSPQCAEAAKP